MLKPLFRLPQKTNLSFVKYFRICLALSIVAIAGTAILLGTKGLNFGIDFKGGTLLEIETKGPADTAGLRGSLSRLGLGEFSLQTFGAPDHVLIRFAEQPGGPPAQAAAVAKVRQTLGPDIQIRRTEQVGETVSKELINSAIWALVLTCVVIFAYVWFRFEWQFALGAIVAMVHDVMATIGVFALFGLDFDLTIVAALLTILGYSMNDTVVIYDRIRENLRRYKRMPLSELIDLSVNETMSRTVMTVGTVLLALVALYLFGGEVIRGFTFAMLFGVIIGTYSSVFIAAPFLILIGVKRDWSGLTKDAGPVRGAQARRVPQSAEPELAAASTLLENSGEIAARQASPAAQASPRAGTTTKPLNRNSKQNKAKAAQRRKGR